MKKFENGEFIEMTPEEVAERNAYIAEIVPSAISDSDRIAALESKIDALMQYQGLTVRDMDSGVSAVIKAQMPTGDYTNPIPYVAGMACTAGLFYSNGEDIWECIKNGIPSGFADTEYFEVILL